MKPGCRAEFEAEEGPGIVGMGHAESDVERPPIGLALWIPDPEQPHWWREYYVRRAPAAKPTRPMGFRR